MPPSVIEPKFLAFPVHRLRYSNSKLFFLISFNPLNAKLNPICHLLALLGGATIVVVSRLRVNGPQDYVVEVFIALVQCFQTEQCVAQCDGRVENERG